MSVTENPIEAVATATGRYRPPDHPQRVELNDEVHARPPEALASPIRLSYLAVFTGAGAKERDAQLDAARRLTTRYGVGPPRADANHFSGDLGPFRLKWERHTEFVRYLFIASGVPEEPFEHPPVELVPREWLESLPGSVIDAVHVAIPRDTGAPLEYEQVAARWFAGNTLVGGLIAGGVATALTDLRIHADGFGRLLVYDRGLAPRQAGRMVQRLLEMNTYRAVALLALPVARELAPNLTRDERELAEIAAALASVTDEAEAALLERLTRLEASIESRAASNQYRFAAAAAYYELIQRRIEELREERIEGLQTFREITERRLAPAMNTCRSAAQRQERLSERVARATQLLSTRVDITRERQNQALLASMNRRAELQLRLQSTVEGLSIAAVTYYVVGLVGYAADGLEAFGLRIESSIAMAASIPIVAVLVALGVRRIRRAVARERREAEP